MQIFVVCQYVVFVLLIFAQQQRSHQQVVLESFTANIRKGLKKIDNWMIQEKCLAKLLNASASIDLLWPGRKTGAMFYLSTPCSDQRRNDGTLEVHAHWALLTTAVP